MDVTFPLHKSAEDYERGNGTESGSCERDRFPFTLHYFMAKHGNSPSMPLQDCLQWGKHYNTGKNHPYCWYQHEKTPGQLRLCFPQRVKYGFKPLFLVSHQACTQLHAVSVLLAAQRGLKRKPHSAFPITSWGTCQLIFKTSNVWHTVKTGIALKWLEKSFSIINLNTAIARGIKISKINSNFTQSYQHKLYTHKTSQT